MDEGLLGKALTITTWYEVERCWLVLQLAYDGQHVQGVIPDEALVDTILSPSAYKYLFLRDLAKQWTEKFGGPKILIVPPPDEGTMWAAYFDNTIDGEVVVKEIGYEQKAIEA